MKNFLGAGCGGLFALIGLMILGFGIREYFKAQASTGWPSVEGVVLRSEMDVDHSSSSSGGSSTTYGADVAYEYQQGGTRRTGDRVEFGEISTGDSSDAQQVLDRYPVGREVTVYYNPEDPADSVLEPGVSGSTFFLPLFGCLFFVVGCLVCGGILLSALRG